MFASRNVEVIKVEQIKSIKKKPGIYMMLDEQRRVMYIGKSNNLNSRVKSYFKKVHEQEKLNRMVRFVTEIELHYTDTHLDALILEIHEIKKHRPLYNKQYKKQYSYLYIVSDDTHRSVLKVSKKDNSVYSIGPFRNESAVNDFASFINAIASFKELDKINFQVIPKRLNKKEAITTQKFVFKMLKDLSLLEEFQERIVKEMVISADELKFELAKRYKDFLSTIQYLIRNIKKYKSVLFYERITNKYKVYLIEDLVIKKVGYLDTLDDIPNCLEGLEDYCDSEKDFLDYKMVVYHELKNNQDKIIK